MEGKNVKCGCGAEIVEGNGSRKRGVCKECFNAGRREYLRVRHAENPEVRERARERCLKWNLENAERHRAGTTENLKHRIVKRVRTRALSAGLSPSILSTYDDIERLLGIRLERYVEWLAMTSDPSWFSWEEFLGDGRKFVIHHKKPISSFDRSDPRWFFKAFNYTNTELVLRDHHKEIHSILRKQAKETEGVPA